MLRVIKCLVIIVGAVGVCYTRAENTAPQGRDERSPYFLQVPQHIHYYITRNRTANLTWEAASVCKIQIKCGADKFLEGDTRVCGKFCLRCRTRRKTKIVTVADFPKDVRTITCQCKVWGSKPVRTEKIIIEKAYLRRNFGQFQSCHVASLNKTVVLPCRPPVGSPRPNVTWFKIGQSSSLFTKGKRIRLRGKKHLVIRRVQMRDSGEYQCVAQNMAARREGLVIRLVVRENVSAVNQSLPECETRRNRTFDYESEPVTLMVGTRDALYTMDLLNTSIRRRIQGENIVSLDFVWDPNLIYWSDRKGINRFNMHNGISEDKPFRHDDVSSVEGLAVDWITEKLYWIDTEKDAIYVGDLRSGMKVKIIDEDLDSPRAIVVSHSQSYIYWTDWGRTPKIERARLDGSERGVFISNGIQFPNGLAIDESEKKLYWAGTDANNYGIIEAVSFDGLNRTVICYSLGFHPFALDIYRDFVYWTDWKKNAVLRLNTSHRGGEEIIVVSGLNKPMGLKILHQREKRQVPNPCQGSDSQCDHMCLYLPFLGRQRCLCEENFKLDRNGKTCRKPDFQGETKVNPTPKSPIHSPLVVILSVVILLLVVAGFVFCVVRIVKKGCPCQRPQDLPHVTRQSTNPDEQGEELLDLTDHTELTRAGSQLYNEPSNLIGQDCSGEPSGSQAAREADSLMTSRKGIAHVVYVEQHGGVTIVGDDAQVHHHYSPKS